MKVFQWMYHKALTKAKYQHAKRWFTEYGGWVVFVAGFSFLPNKLFTVCADLMYWGGEKMQQKLRDIVDWLGWGTVARGGVLNYIYD